MTTTQPYWIDKARHYYLYESDEDSPYTQEAIDECNKESIIIEGKEIFREAIMKHLPKDKSYEQGYHQGREDMSKEITKQTRSAIRKIKYTLNKDGMIWMSKIESIFESMKSKLLATK